MNIRSNYKCQIKCRRWATKRKKFEEAAVKGYRHRACNTDSIHILDYSLHSLNSCSTNSFKHAGESKSLSINYIFSIWRLIFTPTLRSHILPFVKRNKRQTKRMHALKAKRCMKSHTQRNAHTVQNIRLSHVIVTLLCIIRSTVSYHFGIYRYQWDISAKWTIYY